MAETITSEAERLEELSEEIMRARIEDFLAQ